MMNGWDEKHGMDDDAFGAKGNIVSAFDAFRKSHDRLLRTFAQRSSTNRREAMS